MNIKYLIVGGGIAGGSAALKIRELDSENSIMILTNEPYFPYNRPPLTKSLWTGKKNIDDIFLKKDSYYTEKNILIRTNTTVLSLNPDNRTVKTSTGEEISYNKLLISTGGSPRHIKIPEGDMAEINYYRYLNNYLAVREKCEVGKKAVIIGGGFIGSEIAAALEMQNISTTMIFPEPIICQKIFPKELGSALMNLYKEKGITLDSEDSAVAFIKKDTTTSILTRKGLSFEADIIIAGIGIAPNIDLAQNGGLKVANGIIANSFMQTSNTDIFTAGDVALFPYNSLNRQMRVEHWDNAINQGFCAGSNMVTLEQPYTYIPYFFSDLFEFSYEAVGYINSELEIYSDWKDPFKTGVLFYLSENIIQGIMLCNIWDKREKAKKMIGLKVTKSDLRGAL